MMPRASRTTRRIGVALAVTAGGDAFVLDFHDGTTGTHDAYVQHYTPGSPAGTWTQELVLSKPNATSLGQTASYLAVSDRGNAAAAFSTGGTAAYTAATRSGTTWTQPPQASFSVNQIAVSVNDAGDVLIGYEDQGTVPHAYQYDATSMAWSTTAATLNTETEGSRNGSCPLTVKVASTGDATLARCYSSSPQTLESYAFTKGTKTWAAATAIPLTGYSFLGSFVFDSPAVDWPRLATARPTAPRRPPSSRAATRPRPAGRPRPRLLVRHRPACPTLSFRPTGAGG